MNVVIPIMLDIAFAEAGKALGIPPVELKAEFLKTVKAGAADILEVKRWCASRVKDAKDKAEVESKRRERVKEK